MAKAPSLLDEEEIAHQNYDYSLLIIGMTGSGKTSVTNYFLNEKVFKEGRGLTSVTKKAQHALCENGEKKIFIVDCPGFCDPNATHETIMSEIFRCAIWIHGGVDAVAIVVDISKRFSDNWDVGFQQVEQIGVALWKFAFIIFTHEYVILDKPKISKGRHYLKNLVDEKAMPEKLHELLVKVDQRFFCLDTSEKDPSIRNKHFMKLVDIIERIRLENAKKKYTNQLINMFYEQHLQILYHKAKITELERSNQLLRSPSPAMQVPQSPPTKQAPSSSPTKQAPSSSPTKQAPSSSPTKQAPSSSPTKQAPSSSPTKQAPSSSPTKQAPSSSPTKQAPQDEGKHFDRDLKKMKCNFV